MRARYPKIKILRRRNTLRDYYETSLWLRDPEGNIQTFNLGYETKNLKNAKQYAARLAACLGTTVTVGR